jgi:hypothetical protein
MPGAHLASFPGLPLPHAHTHRFCRQACRASPCTEQGCSYVLRGRAREGAPCHRSRLPLPPTASPAHISHVAALLALWMAQPLVTRALFAPATPLPAPRRTSCLQPLPVPTASPAARTSLGSRTGPSSMLSRLSLLPWQVRVGDPQAASAAVSDAVRSDAVACCDAPSPLPAALTLPAARGRPCAAAPIAHRPSRPSL